MEVNRNATISFSMSEFEAEQFYYALGEAIFVTQQPQADGQTWNWRADGGLLDKLYAQLGQMFGPK